jgi:RimJ/RimL family protein N-acetyltransferase/8-oxo-dGTP pyrophosphatase MutT (NUDIX family)
MATPEQPTLTDGQVTLRPWRDSDIDEARLAHDAEMAHRFGFPGVIPPRAAHSAAIGRWREQYEDDRRVVNFLIEYGGRAAGIVEVRDRGDRVGELSWAVFSAYRRRGIATHAVRMLVGYAFDELGLERLEAYVEPDNLGSIRIASRAGLRHEGLLRRQRTTGAERRDYVLLARLRDDPEPMSREGFIPMLNSWLPRKRVIAQILVRDPSDRVLVCELTYKRDWDLPGGVVEVGESPRDGARRELVEELGSQVPISVGPLLGVDWLPAWRGWDDACTLVFDGGCHPPELLMSLVLEQRELKRVDFLDKAQLAKRCTSATARRIGALVKNSPRQIPYLEDGRPG